jgi:hypothetical protein
MRQLSAILDNESYEEDLFPKSEESGDWMTGSAQTPSMSSILDSNLAASMNSLSVTRPIMMTGRPATKVSPMAGSLPINMARPRNIPSMSLVFGRKADAVSKSWSDMWEEDVEEEEAERTRQLHVLKALNARTWSRENEPTEQPVISNVGNNPTVVDEVILPVPAPATETRESPVSDIDGDLVADGFFFHDTPQPVRQATPPPTTYSPPKKSSIDKWAALGERRRAYTGVTVAEKPSDLGKSRLHYGLTFSTFNTGAWDHHGQRDRWNKADRARDVKWNKAKDWNWRRDRTDLGDVEWVGGWQEMHA